MESATATDTCTGAFAFGSGATVASRTRITATIRAANALVTSRRIAVVPESMLLN